MRLTKRAVLADFVLNAKRMSMLRKEPNMQMIKKRMLALVQCPLTIVRTTSARKQHKVNRGGML